MTVFGLIKGYRRTYIEARAKLRAKYGAKYQAFPMAEVEAMDFFLELNRKHERVVH